MPLKHEKVTLCEVYAAVEPDEKGPLSIAAIGYDEYEQAYAIQNLRSCDAYSISTGTVRVPIGGSLANLLLAVDLAKDKRVEICPPTRYGHCLKAAESMMALTSHKIDDEEYVGRLSAAKHHVVIPSPVVPIDSHIMFTHLSLSFLRAASRIMPARLPGGFKAFMEDDILMARYALQTRFRNFASFSQELEIERIDVPMVLGDMLLREDHPVLKQFPSNHYCAFEVLAVLLYAPWFYIDPVGTFSYSILPRLFDIDIGLPELMYKCELISRKLERAPIGFAAVTIQQAVRMADDVQLHKRVCESFEAALGVAYFVDTISMMSNGMLQSDLLPKAGCNQLESAPASPTSKLCRILLATLVPYVNAAMTIIYKDKWLHDDCPQVHFE